MKRLIPTVMILASALAACSDDVSNPSDRDRAPWWLLIIVGVALVVVLATIARHGAKRDRAPDVKTWKYNARTGYAEARWLYDAMGEDLAIWRANTLFGSASVAKPTAGTRETQTWNDLDRRYGAASDALYRLDAGAPDHRTSTAARVTVSTMRATRAALDVRAETRLARLRADKERQDAGVLVSVRDREVRASMELANTRREFADALDKLASLA